MKPLAAVCMAAPPLDEEEEEALEVAVPDPEWEVDVALAPELEALEETDAAEELAPETALEATELAEVEALDAPELALDSAELALDSAELADPPALPVPTSKMVVEPTVVG
jgi:hypothetical protein